MEIAVILDVDKNDPNFQAFKSLGKQLVLGEKTVLRLDCKEVDFSGSILRLVLSQPQNRKGLTLWVHSELMLFAYCGPQKSRLGA